MPIVSRLVRLVSNQKLLPPMKIMLSSQIKMGYTVSLTHFTKTIFNPFMNSSVQLQRYENLVFHWIYSWAAL